MEIFREENWDTWRSGCFTMADFKNLYGEKDRWLLTWTAVHGNDHASRIAIHRLGISVIPEVPVNTDDEKDDLYFLYLVLNEQVKRESALKDYENAIRELGSLLMKEGYAKRAKQQFRKADQLAEQA